ncbi:glucokinase [Emcibacteraceae bacterium]|nr:glucokinase [Emcibacteraceae bacterium]
MTDTMIISDVGGTNGRFAVAHSDSEGNIDHLSHINVYQCRDYNTFTDMLETFINSLNIPPPKTARLAIAGEMTKRHGVLWHYNWDINSDDLEAKFNFDNVTLLNDYEALVYSVPHLSKDDLLTITPFSDGLKNAPYSVFGLGTGLGGAIGAPHNNGLSVIPTEIGHISFAPKTEEQMKLLKFCNKTLDHTSIETLLSGNGIKRIYNFLLPKNNLDEDDLTPAEITRKAINQNDTVAIKCVELLLSILASAAGDIAVSQGARGGIYIGGGIMPKLVSQIRSEQFIKRFCDKGPMSEFNQKIPIHVIISQSPALIGSFYSKYA